LTEGTCNNLSNVNLLRKWNNADKSSRARNNPVSLNAAIIMAEAEVEITAVVAITAEGIMEAAEKDGKGRF
jgi:hypothetical protein